jgi:hypothetical protein
MPSLKAENIEVVTPGVVAGSVAVVAAGLDHHQTMIRRPSHIGEVQQPPDNDGIYHPQRRMRAINVDMEDEDGVVEIDDLAFRNVVCIRGKIIFRRCHFSGEVDAGACCGGGLSVDVTFENCLFESSPGSGVIVDSLSYLPGGGQGNTTVTMLNCVLRNNGAFGAEVRNGGKAVISHCRFVNNGKAQICGYTGVTVSVNDCDITGGGDSGILAMENARLTVARTKIARAKVAGIAVQKKGKAIITECDISGCHQGILVQTGKNTVTVARCTLSRNYIGVFIGVDCIGTVSLDANALQGNTWKAIENDGGDRCAVTMDGAPFGPNGVTHRAEVADPQFGRQMRESPAFQREMARAAAEHAHAGEDSAMATMKARKKAGLTSFVPSCGNCQKVEPDTEKFQLCSRCKEVAYCCKGCQTQHWAAHKAHCQVKVKNRAFLDPTQSTNVPY